MSSKTLTANNSKDKAARISDLAFPICMAVCMVYGMELYNHVLMGAPIAPETLLSPLAELLPMAIAVLVVEKLIGSHIVKAVLNGIGGPEGHALPTGVIMGLVTCLVMCPLMSMVATIAFKHPTSATIAPLWFGTFVRNLPFALVWALLVARPLSGTVVRLLGRAS